MSIANALNNAVSGLTAVSRGTEVISSNLANALTPGYGRRELETSSRLLGGNGGGVHINGVSRIVSETALADHRKASAALAGSSVAADFYSKLESRIGQPQDTHSLSALLVNFDASLITASSRPDSDIRLRAVVEAASQVAQKVNAISDGIQDARTDADRKIGKQVSQLNKGLEDVSRLNRQIIVAQANGRDSSSLQDARQSAIDKISAIVPIQEMARENGRIALFTTRGAALLDGKAPTSFSFQPSGRLTANIDETSPHLGRLVINGEIEDTAGSGLFSGGSLSELFLVRDEYAVSAQISIDAIARELHDRLADPSVDPTIPAGRSGLFTDGGTDFNPADERGFSSRLAINSRVNPENGGASSRIRDGIYAMAPGDVGSSALLERMGDALAFVGPYSSATSVGVTGSISSMSSTLLSDVTTTRLRSESRQAHDVALESSLQSALFAGGVDSDREIELLLHLEKAYAANAKVIKAANEMLDNILRI